MDCFGTYFTHVQTCDNVRVQNATQWTASVHNLHMYKPVIPFVFKVPPDLKRRLRIITNRVDLKRSFYEEEELIWWGVSMKKMKKKEKKKKKKGSM